MGEGGTCGYLQGPQAHHRWGVWVPPYGRSACNAIPPPRVLPWSRLLSCSAWQTTDRCHDQQTNPPGLEAACGSL
jgi:hypothetical protein